ncbi:MAG: hypothetical protein R3B68_10345 [Phycisphaerales bacterium]
MANNARLAGVNDTAPAEVVILGGSGPTRIPNPVGQAAFAWGINNSGVAVGEIGSQGATPMIFHADATTTAFSPFGGDFGIAYAINDDGWIVGSQNSVAEPGIFRAFQWRDGVQQSLATPAGFEHSMAVGITSTGLVAGRLTTSSELSTAVLWDDGQPRLLETPAAFGNSFARGVNNHSLAAGDAWNDPSAPAAFAWEGGVAIALPNLGGPSRAVGVDDLGIIAGFAETLGGESVGVVWADDRLYRLDDIVLAEPGLRILAATAISESGFIAGVARDANNAQVGVLLAPVPAPASLVLLVGAGILARRRRTTTT